MNVILQVTLKLGYQYPLDDATGNELQLGEHAPTSKANCGVAIDRWPKVLLRYVHTTIADRTLALFNRRRLDVHSRVGLAQAITWWVVVL